MACLAHTRKTWDTSMGYGGADRHIIGSLQILEARPGYVKTSLKVGRQHCNEWGSVHGGVMCMLVDAVTGLAATSMGSPSPWSVSTNISCEFVKPGGNEGEELVGVAECIQLGRRIGFMRISFYVNDKLVAYGSHQIVLENKITHVFTPDGEKELPKKAKL